LKTGGELNYRQIKTGNNIVLEIDWYWFWYWYY